MYKFLIALRDFSLATKIIISIILFLFGGGPLLVIIFLAFLHRSKDTRPERFQNEIDFLNGKYAILRGLVENTHENIIQFGSYACEYNGKLFLGSRFISIGAKNMVPSATALPGIEQRKIENDTYYQFVIRKKYSKIAKYTIIFAIAEYIQTNYPDDNVSYVKETATGISAVRLAKILKIMNMK